ncbi:hypothetical protein [Bradyrhizobium sp. Tv2a-2]|uniref:hypothetical protein n=1 Tax=Bradyrhizobium sp. Tv2a-2 TaxID=113395 RepID=UPI0012EC3AFC|nr:hypothetical protein [Bradyrhizobium sp. Tv2a-2]
MNESRRERIRELIRMLESAQEQVHALLVEEENTFLAARCVPLGVGSQRRSTFS